MAHHKAVTITVNVGSEVKGLKISDEGSDALWPNDPPQQIAEKICDLISDSAIRDVVVVSVVGQAVDDFYSQHVSDID